MRAFRSAAIMRMLVPALLGLLLLALGTLACSQALSSADLQPGMPPSTSRAKETGPLRTAYDCRPDVPGAG